jgi:hypothetical protein
LTFGVRCEETLFYFDQTPQGCPLLYYDHHFDGEGGEELGIKGMAVIIRFIISFHAINNRVFSKKETV